MLITLTSMNDIRFVKSKVAQQMLGMCSNTLRDMDRQGIIHTFRTPGGQRLYDVQRFLKENNFQMDSFHPSQKVSVCYCRVSSRNQKEDLQRQEDHLRKMYPTHQIIKDIGSGLNFKRKGLLQILELAHKGELDQLVVAHKDRLCRFGFELIEQLLLSQSHAKIVVLNNQKLSPQEEITQDILHILHVFSSRCYGLRKYRREMQEDQTISNCKTEESS